MGRTLKSHWKNVKDWSIHLWQIETNTQKRTKHKYRTLREFSLKKMAVIFPEFPLFQCLVFMRVLPFNSDNGKACQSVFFICETSNYKTFFQFRKILLDILFIALSIKSLFCLKKKRKKFSVCLSRLVFFHFGVCLLCINLCWLQYRNRPSHNNV